MRIHPPKVPASETQETEIPHFKFGQACTDHSLLFSPIRLLSTGPVNRSSGAGKPDLSGFRHWKTMPPFRVGEPSPAGQSPMDRTFTIFSSGRLRSERSDRDKPQSVGSFEGLGEDVPGYGDLGQLKEGVTGVPHYPTHILISLTWRLCSDQCRSALGNPSLRRKLPSLYAVITDSGPRLSRRDPVAGWMETRKLTLFLIFLNATKINQLFLNHQNIPHRFVIVHNIREFRPPTPFISGRGERN